MNALIRTSESLARQAVIADRKLDSFLETILQPSEASRASKTAQKEKTKRQFLEIELDYNSLPTNRSIR